MSTPDLSVRFPNASASFRRLNAGAGTLPDVPPVAVGAKTQQAVRQRQGSGLNKTETAFLEYMRPRCHKIYPHGITFSVANGTKYTPDFIVQEDEMHDAITAYEVKAMRGNRVHVEDDSSVKTKCAAKEWPSITFILAWFDKSKHAWQFQTIQP